MFNWSVDGVNHLTQQWFWYRVGSLGGESPINAIGVPGIVTPDARTLYLTYASPLFSIEVNYLLTGGTAGSGVSAINESVTVRNLSNNLLDFHLFQYSDFDLNNSPGGDVVQLGKNLSGKFNQALQVKSGITFSESGVVPGADHGEVNFFNATLTKLNDGLPTTLTDATGPLGPGDVTWAFEWDVQINPNDSFSFSKLKQITVVPEPSTLALTWLGLGIAGFLLRQRSHRN